MKDIYEIREFVLEDRNAITALGSFVLGWWHESGYSRHLVAVDRITGIVAGHLQAKDRTLPKPSRHTERCDLILTVGEAYRRRGIGKALLAEAEAFARERGLRLLYAAALADTPGVPFLERNGFVEVERYFPSTLDVTAFDPEPFSDAKERVTTAGIRLMTYSEVDDTPENRQRLYDLHQISQQDQPFRMAGAYVPEPFDIWEKGFSSWDKSTVFLAESPTGKWVGMVSSLSWYYTGVHPDWRGHGIATALKVQMITEAKRRRITEMPTENHEDNVAMLAVNRKLGFRFGTPEIGFIKQLTTETTG